MKRFDSIGGRKGESNYQRTVVALIGISLLLIILIIGGYFILKDKFSLNSSYNRLKIIPSQVISQQLPSTSSSSSAQIISSSVNKDLNPNNKHWKIRRLDGNQSALFSWTINDTTICATNKTTNFKVVDAVNYILGTVKGNNNLTSAIKQTDYQLTTVGSGANTFFIKGCLPINSSLASYIKIGNTSLEASNDNLESINIQPDGANLTCSVDKLVNNQYTPTPSLWINGNEWGLNDSYSIGMNSTYRITCNSSINYTQNGMVYDYGLIQHDFSSSCNPWNNCQFTNSGNNTAVTLISNGFIDPTYTVLTTSMNFGNLSTINNNITNENQFSHLTVSTTAPYDSLVAYYPFDEDFPDYAWGNGSQGIIGNGLDFDGTNDYIPIPASTTISSINTTNAFSISMWVSSYGTANVAEYPISKLDATSFNGFRFYRASNTLILSVGNGTGSNGASMTAGVFPFGNRTWQHIVGVYNGTDLMLYWNGTLAKSSTFYGRFTTNLADLLQLGQYRTTASTQFNGTMDDVAMWNRSLTAEEIQGIYNRGILGQPQNITDGSLVAYYPMNMTNGSYLYDRSGNNNNGQLTNFAGTAYDYSGNNNDGTYQGGAYSNNNGSCLYGACLTTSETSTRYISVPQSTTTFSVNNTQAFTVSAWINSQARSGGTLAYGYVVSTSDAAGKNGYYIRGSNNQLLFTMYNGTGATGGSTVPLGVFPFGNRTWQHVVGVFNGTDSLLYWNGTLVNTGHVYGLFNLSTAMSIGAFNGGTGWNGTIDEVMLFNSSLSASQIQDIYNNQSARFYPRGEQILPQFLLNGSINNNKLNIQVPYQNILGSNLSLKLWQWQPSLGYNETNDGNIVAYWHLDSVNTTNWTLDSSGNGNSARLWNGAYNTTGQYGSAVGFDGVNDYVNTSININNSITWTYSLWFYPLNSGANFMSVIGSPVTSLQAEITSTGVVDVRIRNGTLAGNYLCKSALNQYVSFNAWHFLGLSYNGTDCFFYVDNNLYSVATGGASNQYQPSANLVIGNDYLNRYMNGTIDEVMVWNRSLSVSEMQNLYFKGRVNWNSTAIAEQNLTADIVNFQGLGYSVSNNTFDISSNTTNIIPLFYEYSGVNNFYSPTLGGIGNQIIYNVYNVSSGVTPDLAPSVTFSSQAPADIDTTNAIVSGVNITYNITDTDVTPVNYSTVYLYWKLNSSTTEINNYINGTLSTGWLADNNYTNVTSSFTWNLDDNEIYPATYNINQVIAESSAVSYYSLTNLNSYTKTQLLNVTNETLYNLLEITIQNQTASSPPLVLYYCNSTYVEGNKVSTSTSCTTFATILASTLPTHMHDGGANEWIVPFPIVNGSVNTVKVTQTSYFLARGVAVASNWNIGYMTPIARTSVTQTTGNDGTTWSNLAGTQFLHLHQFRNDTGLWYYACANDTLGTGNMSCSTLQHDVYQQAIVPPSPPVVYSPAAGNYTWGIMFINYTAAVSSGGYPMSFYNITLHNSTGDFITQIRTNNSLNLSYVWNNSYYVGDFRIWVNVTSSTNQSALGISDLFTINAPFSSITTVLMSPASPINYPALSNFSCANNYNLETNMLVDSINDNANKGIFVLRGAGVHSINCIAVGNATADGSSDTQPYTINQGSPSLGLSLVPNPVTIGQSSLATGTGCPSQLTCTLYKDASVVANPFSQVYGALTSVIFSYNTTGNENYSAFSIGATLDVTLPAPSGGAATPSCRYKKFGYYDTSLPWFREGSCI